MAVAPTAAASLIGLATLSLFTGARTAIVPMKIRPAVKTLVAAMYLAATI